MPFKDRPPPLHSVWVGMRQRCANPNHPSWKHYGARGISVCERWQTYANFEADMLPTYRKGLSIDRIDNDLGYAPNNCRWATQRQQLRNQSVTRHVTIEGREYVAADLADIAGIKTDSIVERVNAGLPYEEVIKAGKRHNLGGLKLGGLANGERQRRRTHCKNGHEFTENNTYLTKQGWRTCRACHAARELHRNRQRRHGACRG